MFSTRRAVQENAPEPLRGVLLQYRKDLKLRVVDEVTQEAFLWVCGTPEGQRLTDLLRWAGTARINRTLVHNDADRRAAFAELCRVARRMQRHLLDEPAFNRDKLEAEILFLRLRVLCLAPMARKSLDRTKAANEARAEPQKGLREALEALRDRAPTLNISQALKRVQLAGEEDTDSFCGVNMKTARRIAREYFQPAKPGQPRKY